MKLKIDATIRKHESFLVSCRSNVSLFNPQEVCCVCEGGRTKTEKKKRGVPANVSSRHKRRKIPTSLFLVVEVRTIHSLAPPTSPQLFLYPPLYSLETIYLWRTVLWAPDAWPSSQVAWSHGSTTVCLNLVFCIQTNLKGPPQRIPSWVCCVLSFKLFHMGGEMPPHGIWWRIKRECHVKLIYSKFYVFFPIEASMMCILV